jgi:hypothetical protein
MTRADTLVPRLTSDNKLEGAALQLRDAHVEAICRALEGAGVTVPPEQRRWNALKTRAQQ